MRIAIYGRNLDDLRQIMQKISIPIVEDNPEFVIAYGGDGALLGAERDFPNIPKLPLRDWRTSHKCPKHSEEAILQKFIDNKLKKESIIKLKATVNKQTLCGLNDITIHTNNTVSAVRYRIWLNGQLYNNQIIGDGLIIATPFGSTGYFRSITRSIFQVGLGVAFNNSTEPLDHLVIADKGNIKVEILRGPAILCADNNPSKIVLHKGEYINITTHTKQTKIYGLDIFRCKECEKIRHLNA